MIQAAAAAALEVFEQIVTAQVTLLSCSQYDQFQSKIKSKTRLIAMFTTTVSQCNTVRPQITRLPI